MSKVSDFLDKYGYTFRSYFIGIFLLPPASFYIAWKIPNLNKLVRMALCILVLVPHVFIFLTLSSLFK